MRRVGAALASVHRAGASEEREPGRFERDALLARIDVIAHASDATLAAQAPILRAKLDAWTTRRDAQLPRGLIHGDLFRDNVLWSKQGEIAALLDFESASGGVLAYDVMVTALAWCFGDALDLALFRAMIEGYESVRPLSDTERRGLLAEGCAAAIRFTITRITDYAMRVSDQPRVIKDWRRFAARLAALEALGDEGMARIFAR
jgi:homoserine kinase type II